MSNAIFELGIIRVYNDILHTELVYTFFYFILTDCNLEMKILYWLSLCFVLHSCVDRNTKSVKRDALKTQHTVVPEFQAILDSAQVKGAILIYDLHADQWLSNNYEWAKKGQLPASTFKIPNSIIALETGVVKNDSTLFKWDGQPRALKNWEQDLILRDAFHFSCVPCYQEVARDIGVKTMKEYLGKLDYGEMEVDSTSIAMFWLEGKSRINQFQQVDFLKRLYLSQLPISKRTVTIMKRMMVMEINDVYTLSGKTGWSISNDQNNGWFVGYLETQNKVYFFATNIEPTGTFDRDRFIKTREDVTYAAFRELGITMM